MARYSGFFGRDRLVAAGIPVALMACGQCAVLALAVFGHHRRELAEAVASLIGAIPVYALIGFILLVQQQRKAELTAASDGARPASGSAHRAQ